MVRAVEWSPVVGGTPRHKKEVLSSFEHKRLQSHTFCLSSTSLSLGAHFEGLHVSRHDVIFQSRADLDLNTGMRALPLGEVADDSRIRGVTKMK